jgi:hypothetical protein
LIAVFSLRNGVLPASGHIKVYHCRLNENYGVIKMPSSSSNLAVHQHADVFHHPVTTILAAVPRWDFSWVLKCILVPFHQVKGYDATWRLIKSLQQQQIVINGFHSFLVKCLQPLAPLPSAQLWITPRGPNVFLNGSLG